MKHLDQHKPFCFLLFLVWIPSELDLCKCEPSLNSYITAIQVLSYKWFLHHCNGRLKILHWWSNINNISDADEDRSETSPQKGIFKVFALFLICLLPAEHARCDIALLLFWACWSVHDHDLLRHVSVKLVWILSEVSSVLTVRMHMQLQKVGTLCKTFF